MTPAQALKIISLAALFLAALAGVGTAALAAKAQVGSEVPAGKWKAVRLRNLPEGAAVSVRVVADGNLDVILVHEAELKRHPSPLSPVFQGRLDRALSFSVVIPRTGNYYVILDNRRGTEQRKVRVLIEATAPGSRNAPADEEAAKKENI